MAAAAPYYSISAWENQKNNFRVFKVDCWWLQNGAETCATVYFSPDIHGCTPQIQRLRNMAAADLVPMFDLDDLEDAVTSICHPPLGIGLNHQWWNGVRWLEWSGLVWLPIR